MTPFLNTVASVVGFSDLGGTASWLSQCSQFNAARLGRASGILPRAKLKIMEIACSCKQASCRANLRRDGGGRARHRSSGSRRTPLQTVRAATYDSRDRAVRADEVSYPAILLAIRSTQVAITPVPL